jgi:hypothetical protein
MKVGLGRLFYGVLALIVLFAILVWAVLES